MIVLYIAYQIGCMIYIHCTHSRFGHSSVFMANKRIVVTGGFGYATSSGCHGRLDTTIVLSSNEQGVLSCKSLQTTGTNPGQCMSCMYVLPCYTCSHFDVVHYFAFLRLDVIQCRDNYT